MTVGHQAWPQTFKDRRQAGTSRRARIALIPTLHPSKSNAWLLSSTWAKRMSRRPLETWVQTVPTCRWCPQCSSHLCSTLHTTPATTPPTQSARFKTSSTRAATSCSFNKLEKSSPRKSTKASLHQPNPTVVRVKSSRHYTRLNWEKLF